MAEQLLTHRTKNVSAHIGIGGWGGGRYFSSNVATPENRTAFVKSVVNFADQYDVDGINFEYVLKSISAIELPLSAHLAVGNILTTRA